MFRRNTVQILSPHSLHVHREMCVAPTPQHLWPWECVASRNAHCFSESDTTNPAVRNISTFIIIFNPIPRVLKYMVCGMGMASAYERVLKIQIFCLEKWDDDSSSLREQPLANDAFNRHFKFNSENYHFVNHLCAYLRYNNIPKLFTFLS